MTTEIEVKKMRRRTRRRRRPTAAKELPQIFFCGDPHGCFDQINQAAREYQPDALVILGDMQAPAPLEVVLEEALQYAPVWWIPGNHDSESDEMYDNLWRSKLGLPMSAVYVLRVWAAFFAARFGCLMIPPITTARPLSFVG